MLNDKSYETTEIRATELRKRFSENFGDYWHVIHDDNPFVVACDKTTFTIIENGNDDETKNDEEETIERTIRNWQFSRKRIVFRRAERVERCTRCGIITRQRRKSSSLGFGEWNQAKN